jgi:hypothetical protein
MPYQGLSREPLSTNNNQLQEHTCPRTKELSVFEVAGSLRSCQGLWPPFSSLPDCHRIRGKMVRQQRYRTPFNSAIRRSCWEDRSPHRTSHEHHTTIFAWTSSIVTSLTCPLPVPGRFRGKCNGRSLGSGKGEFLFTSGKSRLSGWILKSCSHEASRLLCLSGTNYISVGGTLGGDEGDGRNFTDTQV